MNTYLCNDGNAEIEIEAENPQEAAQEYVDGGDWGDPVNHTFWVDVSVKLKGTNNAGWYKITMHPEEPECTQDEHDWQSPYWLLGGVKENPGCWGHGGGAVSEAVCLHCGCSRLEDTWAQDMSDGTQGHYAIEYTPGKYEEELAEHKKNKQVTTNMAAPKNYSMELNLEDSEDRANITCSDYVAAYVAQYGGSKREGYESFCNSAVIDATRWPEDKALVSALYSHLDPDGRDANITVAQAGRIALELN
jgi:hypothetical protein